MSKDNSSKKNIKKPPEKNLKQKRAAKAAKREKKYNKGKFIDN